MMYRSRDVQLIRGELWERLFHTVPQVPPEADDINLDQYMYRIAGEIFRTSTTEYAQNVTTLGKEGCLRAFGNDIILSGLLLLAFGEIDTLEALLEHVPPLDSPLITLFSKIYLLMPIPFHGIAHPFPDEDLQAIRNWVKQYKDEIVWDEKEGYYLLTTKKEGMNSIV